MKLSDKLLLLLSHNSLTQSGICMQLGAEWYVLKETMGVMRMCAWVHVFQTGYDDPGDKRYQLSGKGREELDRRIKAAS